MKGHCPICGGEAKNATPGNFDGLIIKCKHCGDYGITDSALNDFLRLDFDARQSALVDARRPQLGLGLRSTQDTSDGASSCSRGTRDHDRLKTMGDLLS
jgi:hypothetical protein